MILYEIKEQKKLLILLLAGLFSFCAVYISMIYFPQLIVEIIQIINGSKFLSAFIGINEPIDSLTFKEAIFSAITILNFFIIHISFSNSMATISREKRMGTLCFLISHKVSRIKLFLTKLCIIIIATSIQLLVWWLVIRRISLNGVTDVDFFVETISEDVANVMLSITLINLFFITAGFFLGSIFSFTKKEASFHSRCLMFLLVFFAILPNFINALLALLNVDNIVIIKKNIFIKIISVFQKFNPLYICYPFTTCENVSIALIVSLILISCVLLLMSGFIYCKKRIY